MVWIIIAIVNVPPLIVFYCLLTNAERRSIALHNIETLLSNVDEAHHSGIVLDAYKIGSKTLQKVLNESGLKYDNVDEVLADVRETLDQHREVQDVMSSSSADVPSQDEDELELELRDLMDEKPAATAAVSAQPMNLLSNNNKPKIVIDDEHLIAMLDELEVEEGSISQASHRTLESLEWIRNAYHFYMWILLIINWKSYSFVRCLSLFIMALFYIILYKMRPYFSSCSLKAMARQMFP